MAETDPFEPGPELLAQLDAAGVAFDTESLRSVVAGVAAAPCPPGAPDAWMSVIVSEPGPALADALRAYRDQAVAGADGGLAIGKSATDVRLRALREELARRGLDGMIVPRADAHQGEFVPPHAQRLRWLTGFSGSAGMAVITASHAALFVDGRYTIQAENEVDTGRIAVVDTGRTRPDQWLADNLPARTTLGYDAWLHTPDGLAKLERGTSRAQAALVACADNPVDAVWDDQPAPPLAPVAPHDLVYAGETSVDKRGRIARDLETEGADAAVLTLPDALAWLLNIRGRDIAHTPVALSFGIVHADGAVDWFIDPQKLTAEAWGALDDRVRVRVPTAFASALDALGANGATVLVDPAAAPCRVFDRLEAAGATIRRAPDPVQSLKACKNETELAGARAAHVRDGAAVTQFLAWLDGTAAQRAADGMPVTEMEAASVLAGYRQVRDRFRDDSFETIAGAGEHGAIVHYRVTPETDRPLGEGELFLCDSGGQYLDGTTDITRTVAIGTPSADMRDAYTRVLKGHVAIATLRVPRGTTGSQIDAFARRPLWEVGLDYAHGTGHGVGAYLGVHEGPQRISKMPSRVALRPGMICSNEPGYYKADRFGIRIENLIAVRSAESDDPDTAPEGAAPLWFETLSLAPYCRELIVPGLLTVEERAWIDAYHARIRDTLMPHLDSATADWLARATAPLGEPPSEPIAIDG